jgi:hypothetical protein
MFAKAKHTAMSGFRIKPAILASYNLYKIDRSSRVRYTVINFKASFYGFGIPPRIEK